MRFLQNKLLDTSHQCTVKHLASRQLLPLDLRWKTLSMMHLNHHLDVESHRRRNRLVSALCQMLLFLSAVEPAEAVMWPHRLPWWQWTPGRKGTDDAIRFPIIQSWVLLINSWLKHVVLQEESQMFGWMLYHVQLVFLTSTYFCI